MNAQRIRGMLGLALRARQAASGMDACRIMARSGKCGVLLLDGSAGPNTRKKAEDLCRRTGTPMRVIPAGLIGEATGKECMVAGLLKGGFADQVLADTAETGRNDP